MTITGSRASVCTVVISFLAALSATADTISVDYSGWTSPVVAGDRTTVSWSFDLSGLGLDAPGVVIDSGILEIWANGVDLTLPANYIDSTNPRHINHYRYMVNGTPSDLRDPVVVEGNAGVSSYLAAGNARTVIPLTTGSSDDYGYLRDGALDVSLTARETNTWWSLLDYSYSNGHYYYVSKPNWDGSLTLVNSRLTVNYTPPVAEPTSFILMALGISGVLVRRYRRGGPVV